ncbi:E3 ubiquitin-protein ligase BRE1-like isoform X1 [Phthorimaea operculella]|nr:E3 ubiquitin-protein ligase BRE1-like isoform X1 [Phthorimaea operculella]
MPKSLDKTKGARKRKKTPPDTAANTESDGSETNKCPKKKKIPRKTSALEGIAMSKQLAAEMQKKKVTRSRNSTKVNKEPRLLPNGKPMPSLAELEAMYENSDGDDDPPKQSIASTVERSSRSPTPEQKPILTEEINTDSPETLLKLTSKALDILSKKIIELDDDGPPPPVIPQKRPKKRDEPYIVGCKERPQVPWAPKTKWCVGTDDYGVKPQEPEEEDPEKGKGVSVGNVSKSIFNAKSDEIAKRLKELETLETVRTGSPDSNKTVEYDFLNSPISSMPRSFSPLPSTSRDAETILKNDQLFNESLQIENTLSESLKTEKVPSESSPDKNDSQDDVEIIDIPYDTVVLDDTLPDVNVKAEKRSFVEDDDCCILVEPEIKRKRFSGNSTKADSPPKDDIYGSIDLTQPFISDEVYEINDDDIDDLIAESKAILEKDKKKNVIDTVTAVDPDVVVVNAENDNSGPKTSSPTQNTSITANNSDVICYPPGIVECVELDTTVADTSSIVAPVHETQNNTNDEIAEVVTNFFNPAIVTDPSIINANISPDDSTPTILIDCSAPQSSIRSNQYYLQIKTQDLAAIKEEEVFPTAMHLHHQVNRHLLVVMQVIV